MIGIGQATYLKTLISQYADAINDLSTEHVCHREDDLKFAEACVENAKRKLDNYIAKLTEAGK